MATDGTQEIGNDDQGSSELVASLQADLTGQPPAAPGAAAPAPEKPAEPAKPGAAAPAAPAPEKPAAPAKPEKPAAEPAKPGAPAKPSTPAKPAAAAPKPDAKPINPDDPNITAPQLRKALKELQENSTKTVAQKEQELQKLTQQIASFQGKRIWSDEDQKLADKANTRLAELESDLYGRDYRQSPEFKTKYQDPFDKIWKEANDELVGMNVKVTGKNAETGEDELQERTITANDILAVVNAPANQRVNLAKQLFGSDYDTVVTHARELNLLRKGADEAVAEKQKNYQTETQAKSAEIQKTQGQFQDFVKSSSEKFITNNPDIFQTEDGDTEAAEAVQKGLTFVDSSVSGSVQMNINERAARAALIRGMAASFPRLLLERNRLKAENERLRGENEGFRKSDPGNAGEGGGGGGGEKGADEVGGSDDLVDKSLGASQ